MIKSKNFLLFLAGFLVVALGIMAYVIYSQTAISPVTDSATLTLSQQSTSDEADSIEEDINDTNFDDLDKELGDIEKEL